MSLARSSARTRQADPSAPSNSYYRGSILCLSYLVLMGGFAWAPSGRDTSDNPGFGLLQVVELPSALSLWQRMMALMLSLFTR